MRGAGTIFSPNNLAGATKRVYDYLYDEIVSCRLAPGSALSELDISKRLETSRSPVREALMVLEGEGLVRRYPGRGCFVAEITVQDLNEIFALRSLLEVAALRKSYSRIDDASLEHLAAALNALGPDAPYETYFAADRQLHELIVSSCGNMRLMLILRMLNGQIEQLRRIAAKQPQRLQDSRREHLEIIQAIRDRELERACALLAQHIANIQTAILNVRMQMNMNKSLSAG